MDEGIKPIVPLVILVILAGVLFVAASPIGDMVVDGIKNIITELFNSANGILPTP